MKKKSVLQCTITIMHNKRLTSLQDKFHEQVFRKKKKKKEKKEKERNKCDAIKERK